MLCDLLWPSWRGCYVILHVKPFDFWPHSSPCYCMLAVFEPILYMIWYHQHYYVGMIWYRLRLYDGMMWHHPSLWDGMIWYPPKFSVFSNPWEAAVELYRHLRSRTFGYRISLSLLLPPHMVRSCVYHVEEFVYLCRVYWIYSNSHVLGMGRC
jgi:hypothetical protein